MAIDSSYVERQTLLNNASSTGSYVTLKGGTYIWGAEGTFSGATLQLQAKNANGTATDISGATLTAAGFVSVAIAANTEVRVSITGSPSAMFSSIAAVP